jgi:hypothetical protein
MWATDVSQGALPRPWAVLCNAFGVEPEVFCRARNVER